MYIEERSRISKTRGTDGDYFCELHCDRGTFLPHTLAHLLLSPILPLFITVSRTLLIGIVKILFGFKEISIHNNFVYFKSWFICKNMYKFIC